MNYVHADDREFVKKSVGEALYGRPYDIEHRIILPDGAIRIVHEQGEVTFGESGEPLRMLGTVQDITESKEKEMRLIMSERLAALGQMASGIAHEINNPLATIAACAEGLLNRMRKGQSDPDLSENYLNIINEEVIRCKGITTSMLSFVRKTDYEKKDVDIHDILDKTLELIGFQGRLKEVEVIKHYGGILMARGNEGELKQVFLAIMVNAVDAMEDRGSLTIGTMIIPSRSNFQLSGRINRGERVIRGDCCKRWRDLQLLKSVIQVTESILS
jgi:signal transduction histidine kinase